MRILFVTTNLPVPPTNGQAIRTLSIIRGLASLGHDLSFVSLVPRGHSERKNGLDQFCLSVDLVGSSVANMSQGSAYLGRAISLLKCKPYSLERFHVPSMQDKVSQHLEKGETDVIVSDSIYALANVPKTGVPIVLNTHNVEYAIYDRYTTVESSLIKRKYAGIEKRLLKGAEQRSCCRAAIVLTCSAVDRELLTALCSERGVYVVPNVVDIEHYESSHCNGSSAGPVLLFQGSMDWYPNRDAVEHFVRNIFPKVRERFPEVKFIVAGRNPPAHFVAEFTRFQGVEFTGTVPDMRPYLDSATLVVVPLRVGGGTRIKILEACAAGKAVVSTTVGAEGLNLQNGTEIVLADSPSAFAEEVTSLLTDRQKAKSVAAAAKAVVVGQYSQHALVESLRRAFEGLSNTKPD